MSDPDLVGWLAPRARLVGRAALAGAVAGALGTGLALFLYGDLDVASTQVFALASLVFAFGLLGWSGSVMAGRGIESLQEHLGTASDWTERKSRRAMARVGGFGVGGMVGVVVGTVLMG